MGRIVVGVDGSEASMLALRWAIDEARGHPNREVEAVLVWDYLNQPGGEPFRPDFGPADAERVLDALVDAVGRPEGVEIRTRAVVGHPVDALLDECGAADLLVVGTRGVGGFRGMLLGSVSRGVVERARCPVVVVPAPHD